MLLSICILTFNRERTLAETLDCILPQITGRSDVELLVCDNASNAATEALVRHHLANVPNLRYHRNPRNLGFDGNVVTCILQGRGDYIAFFSDDDLASPGHVEYLVRTLQTKRPSVLYMNHRPFLHNDVRQLGQPAAGEMDLENRGGEAFLLTAGLGFISALVLEREAALSQLEKVVDGAGAAHVDIASRLVLQQNGLCLYHGSRSVYARHEYGAGSILVGGCVSLAKLYRTLVAERLLSESGYAKWLRSQVRHVLPRQVISARGQGRGEFPLSGMIELYGGVPSFFFLVLPLYLVPRQVIAVVYRICRYLLHAWRRGRVSVQSA